MSIKDFKITPDSNSIKYIPVLKVDALIIKNSPISQVYNTDVTRNIIYSNNGALLYKNGTSISILTDYN